MDDVAVRMLRIRRPRRLEMLDRLPETLVPALLEADLAHLGLRAHIGAHPALLVRFGSDDQVVGQELQTDPAFASKTRADVPQGDREFPGRRLGGSQSSRRTGNSRSPWGTSAR